MAKLSMKERERRRTETVAKYAAKRKQLKAIISNPRTSERGSAAAALRHHR